MFTTYFTKIQLQFLPLFFPLLTLGCSEPARTTQTASYKKADAEGTKNDIFRTIDTKKFQVDFVTLNSEKMLVLGLAVGDASTSVVKNDTGTDTPILRYEIPPAADFVEIMRCVEGSSPVNVAASKIAAGGFFEGWDFLENQENVCTRIHKDGGISQTDWLDRTADSGRYRYFVRACANPLRLATEVPADQNCGRYVSMSQIVKYSNSRKIEERTVYEKRERYVQIRDTASRNLSLQIANLNNIKARCLIAEQERVAAIAEAKKMSEILGLGIKLSALMFQSAPLESYFNILSESASTEELKSLSSVLPVAKTLAADKKSGLTELIQKLTDVKTQTQESSLPIKDLGTSSLLMAVQNLSVHTLPDNPQYQCPKEKEARDSIRNEIVTATIADLSARALEEAANESVQNRLKFENVGIKP